MYLTLDNYSVSTETQPQQSIDECVGSVASDDLYLLFMMMRLLGASGSVDSCDQCDGE